MDKSKNEDVINPLDFLDFDPIEEKRKDKPGVKSAKKPAGKKPKDLVSKGIFITGTDTEVGKTVITAVLGLLLKSNEIDVGVMKPVQCGGSDSKFLKQVLDLKEKIDEINPYYAKEPLSPNVAFRRAKIDVDINKIKAVYKSLQAKHEIMLVEGAGGLLVPILDDYLVSDLIKDLGLELIIVSRLGLGTINHTLLTVNQARELGIKVRGVIFNEALDSKGGISEETNPGIISNLGGVPILGTIPHLNDLNEKEVQEKCTDKINIVSLVSAERTNEGKQLASWDKKYVWHPFTQMKDWQKEEPLIIDKAEGNYLIDINGKKYLDGVSSLWVNVHGHNHKKITKAIKDQLNKLEHSTLLGLSNTPSIVLAKKLAEITPQGLEKVFYSDSGSTSVEIAIKMAYQYWQNTKKESRTKIVHLNNSYHGDTLGSVSVGGIELFHKVYKDLIFQAIKVDFPDFYRSPEGKEYPQYAFEYLQGIEDLFKKEGKTIAAIVVEPIVQAAGGMLVWPEGLLKRIREICTKYDVLLIADEVATGFGRTGKMFACEHERVRPDFLCLAKGLTGGYMPLAATLTTKRIYEGFMFDYKEQKTFFHGHTYTGNPLACAAAIANIETFEKENTLHKLQQRIAYFSSKLKSFEKLGNVGQVRQKGFMVGIELVKNKKDKTPYDWQDGIGVKVCKEARKRNVILRPLGNVIVLMPALSITKEQLDYIMEVTLWAIDRVTGNKVRPARTYYKKRVRK